MGGGPLGTLPAPVNGKMGAGTEPAEAMAVQLTMRHHLTRSGLDISEIK